MNKNITLDTHKVTPIDLHTHTTASDGTFSPIELIDYAIEKNLSTIAITDHDTIKGIEKARHYLASLENTSLKLISGIEFSTTSPNYSKDIHILGLFINEQDPVFKEKLETIIRSRNTRNAKMTQKLTSLGFPMTLEDVEKNATNGVITRAHFAKVMLEKGYVKNIKEAFEKHLGNNCPAYVPREKLYPETAIQMILENGGMPVLAHPTLYDLNLRELDQLIAYLTEKGLMGIEGIYSLYTKAEEKYIKDFANTYNLMLTGGSDFHGNNKVAIDLAVGKGNLFVPSTLLEPMTKKGFVI